MSTDLGENAPYEFTPEQLRRMGDDEARETLTVAQYERREKILDLHAGADDQVDEWDDEDQTVTDLVVHADPEQLGTRVDLYGNDVLVHMDSDNDDLKETIDALESEFGDVSGGGDIDELDDDALETFEGLVTDALGALLVRWNGHDWANLDPFERDVILDSAREKWGLDGMFLGFIDVVIAVQEDREERLDVVDSFRGAQRRGRR